MLKQDWPPERVAKFRQAGFVYLHVAILYEAAVYAMLQAGTLPLRIGPPWASIRGCRVGRRRHQPLDARARRLGLVS